MLTYIYVCIYECVYVCKCTHQTHTHTDTDTPTHTHTHPPLGIYGLYESFTKCSYFNRIIYNLPCWIPRDKREVCCPLPNICLLRSFSKRSFSECLYAAFYSVLYQQPCDETDFKFSVGKTMA